MKTIIFIRHGKSSWEYDVSDQERPLKKRGVKDGNLIGENLKAKSFKIDKVFSSPAIRALHTAGIVCSHLNIAMEDINVKEELYDFSGGAVLDHIKNLDNSLETVLYFGHNYAFTNIVNKFGNIQFDNVPTTGLVALTFESNNWSEITNGKTSYHVFPRAIKDARK
jgi:phosphohistidine phosphatase